jgi:hypothetical protein
MSRNYFGPGNSHGVSKYLRKLIQNDSERNRDDFYCNCFQETVNKSKRGYIDDTQTKAERDTQILQSSLGGRTVFGNGGLPRSITYLGGSQGQSGGAPKPLRNKF